MSLLFDEGEGGYRLHEFQFYNWGCFDNNIWKIYPHGKSSLLTGANGSGKTTLVDALVTLLVPPGKRHYNQSSGADKKRERTEESYVLGAVSTKKADDGYSALAEYLRKKNDYSLLAGIFKNERLKKEITLGQVRWFTSSGLQRVYFTSPQSLSLMNDLLPIDFSGNFRKVWKEKFSINFFDSFNLYVKYFAPILGLRSEKGLSLFSHIVGVKVLGNLNEFIRSNMLDAPNMEEAFIKLHTNYEQLFNAHRKIELADKQLEMLEPVIKSIDKLEDLIKKQNEAQRVKELLPGYFGSKIYEKIEEEILLKEDELNLTKEKMKVLSLDREAREDERRDLDSAIDKNDTAQRIKGIESEIKLVETKKTQKLNSYNHYSEIAEKLELHKLQKEEDFLWNKKKAVEKEAVLSDKEKETDDRLFEARDSINKLDEEKDSLEKDIVSLQNRKNNIPRINIEIRERIARALKLEESELPFAGELIKVKESERDWELAAERILHSFGLCLLVSEEHYKKVNRFVNKNNLKGRLIYFKVKKGTSWGYETEEKSESLIFKLEVKKDSPFFSWADDYIHKHFNYICVSTPEDLTNHQRGVTREGLIKSGERHEKDDRSLDTGRKHYVLGWDNRAKIAYLAKKLKKIKETIFIEQNTFSRFEKQKQRLYDEKRKIERFKEFKSFQELSWWEEASKLKELNEQKERLTSASKELKELQNQLEKVIATVIALSDEISQVNRHIGRQEESLKGFKDELGTQRQLLELYKDQHFDENIFSLFTPPEGLSLKELKQLRDKSLKKADEDLDKSKENFNTGEKAMLKLMRAFKVPGEKVIRKYPGWEGFTVNLQADTAYREDFRLVYKSVKNDDLPKYKKNFKEFLSDNMQQDLIDFKESLEQGERDIVENIIELNSALKEIEYNKSPSTYVILQHEKSRDPMILNFRSQLNNILGDAIQTAHKDEASLENIFKRMQKFILDIREDANKRKKLLNVRNWLTFSAIEKYKEGDEPKNYYKDSQSLSGGEKAKLAYTILASAIAYQFNISGSFNQDKSFRFAIVDEAFSKVDPENSIYAMELFKKLELQLMIVTPGDRINIVEDYINFIHYVENNGRSSTLHNFTIEEYKEKKVEFNKEGMIE